MRPYNQQRNGRPNLNAFAIEFSRENAGVRFTLGVNLPACYLSPFRISDNKTPSLRFFPYP